jgi:hypothetical protein
LNEEILRADSALRRKTTVILTIAVVASIVALVFFQRWLLEWMVSSSAQQAMQRTRILMSLALTASAMCLAVLAAYCAKKGSKAQATARWPLENARVLFDKPVRRGAQAKRIGSWLQILAAILLLLALGCGAISLRLFSLAT